MAEIDEVECIVCGWAGKELELHTDRGGHNFLCPECQGSVKILKGKQQYRCPKLAADIVLFNSSGHDQTVLLIERKNVPFGWALPGGFVDYGESCETAARRELKEETNLTVIDHLELIGEFSEPNRDPRGHVVSIAYYCSAANGNPQAKDDAKNLKFFRIDDMPTLAFPDHWDMIIKALQIKES